MDPKYISFAQWPRLKNKQPIFEDTRDALYYAQLICNDLDEQKMIKFYHDDCHTKLKYIRESKMPDLDRMVILAVKAQFFRECLEECTRIKNESLTSKAAL